MTEINQHAETGLSPEELAAESVSALPDKEVVSILDLNDNGEFHRGIWERFSASRALARDSQFRHRWRLLRRTPRRCRRPWPTWPMRERRPST